MQTPFPSSERGLGWSSGDLLRPYCILDLFPCVADRVFHVVPCPAEAALFPVLARLRLDLLPRAALIHRIGPHVVALTIRGHVGEIIALPRIVLLIVLVEVIMPLIVAAAVSARRSGHPR